MNTRSKAIFLLWAFMLSSLFVNFSLTRVQALGERPIVEGKNFRIYFVTGETLVFQQASYEVYFQVTSGTLNASVVNLLMYEPTGKIEFTPLTTCIINITASDPTVKIKQNLRTNIYGLTTFNHAGYTVNWAIPTVGFGLDFLPIGMGIAGIVSMIVSPLYFIRKVKERDVKGIGLGLAFTFIGLALFIGWISL